MSHNWIYLFINSYVHRHIAQVTNLKSTQSIQTQVSGFDQAKKKKQETNINLMYSYCEGYMFCALFFCFCCAFVWFKGDLHSLYLHRDKYIL